MVRKKYRDKYSASAATTLRLVKFANEKRGPNEDRVGRVVVGDSWFASVSTAEVLRGEFAIKFIGNVKTATRKFPVEDMWRVLHQGERGETCVCVCVIVGIFLGLDGITTTAKHLEQLLVAPSGPRLLKKNASVTTGRIIIAKSLGRKSVRFIIVRVVRLTSTIKRGSICLS